MFARQNSAEEVSPWAIIKMRAPVRPQGVWERIPATTRPMWLTEEYAIRALRSVWRKQIDPVMIMRSVGGDMANNLALYHTLIFLWLLFYICSSCICHFCRIKH